MTPSTKKLIGLFLFPIFMLLYIGLILAIADRLPNHWAIHLVFYIVAGTAWAFPLRPVMYWMNRG
ncbi:MAG: DUF2842 domain-containing protein [Parvularculaceae bacterium]